MYTIKIIFIIFLNFFIFLFYFFKVFLFFLNKTQKFLTEEKNKINKLVLNKYGEAKCRKKQRKIK